MKKQCFVILPYLKTSHPIAIRGITFRSYVDIASLDAPDKHHLSTIFAMFFLKDEWRIEQMSYAILDIEGDGLSDEKAMRRLNEVHNILAYIYCSPHRSFLDPFLRTEHANLYTLFPENLSSSLVYPHGDLVINISPTAQYQTPHNRSEIPGYRTLLNGEQIFWVAAGSRIYPPSNRLWLNISQDLYGDLQRSSFFAGHNPLGSFVIGTKILGSIEERLFTSLRWYNKSNSILADDDTSLLHLAVAFESLMALDQGPNVTQRFKESVLLLSGSVPKLDSWVEQFYKARSAIVHEGSATETTFNAACDRKKTRSEYRSLVSYGRAIFRICFNSVVCGAHMASEIGLASLLISNQERFEKICAVLDKPGINSSDALLSLQKEIFDIDEYRFISETNLSIDTMIAALRFAARHLLSINPAITKNLLDMYSQLTQISSSQDHFAELELIQQLAKRIPEQGSISNGLPFDATSLVFSLTNSVEYYTFMQYYALKSQREKASGSP